MADNIRQLGSGKFQARYTHPTTGKRVARTFKRKVEAKDWLKAESTDISRGEWFDPDAAKLSVRAWSERWLGSLTVSSRSKSSYESDLRVHILPTLGDLPLSAMTPARVREWHGDRLASGRPAATAKAYRTLKAMLNAAVDDGRIPRNPCNIRGASQSRPTRDIRPLTLAEVWSVHDALAPRYQAWMLVASYAGLRFGETAALRVADVDLASGVVTVTKQLQETRSGQGFEETAPKTAAGRRSVGLPPFVVEAVARHIDEHTDRQPSSFLFTMEGGGPLRHANFHSRVWRQATAGLSWSPRIHDLRHTCASLALAAHVDIKQLQAMLGHASAKTTLDRYGHLMSSAPRAVAAKLADSGRPGAMAL
jgi:integrase